MAKESLAKSEAELLLLNTNEVPRLQQENERARLLLSQMQSELDEGKTSASTAVKELQIQLSSVKEEAERLSVDNALLKQELAKAVQVRSAAHTKVDEARRKLGLSPSEAQVFIKEFDESARANAQLRKDLQQISIDRNHLAQQCEQRSSHCMTLISENKRLVDQISNLRQQVVSSEADAWRLRQQLSASAQRDQHLVAKREAASHHTSLRPAFSVRPSSATIPLKQEQGSKGKEMHPRQLKLCQRIRSRDQPLNLWAKVQGALAGPSPPQPSTADPDPLNISVLQQAMQLRHERHRLMLLREQEAHQVTS